LRASTSTQLEIAEATQISDWDPRSLIRAHVVSKEKKQKIQRLKRQRRQIGKKKKRKRISPRSLWLRFNLYDRFLKKLPRSPIGSYSPKPKGHWLQSEIAYPKGLLQQGPFPSRQRGCSSKSLPRRGGKAIPRRGSLLQETQQEIGKLRGQLLSLGDYVALPHLRKIRSSYYAPTGHSRDGLSFGHLW
jgi:hypothetical protein